jgi:single-stranded DNA-binding protein
MYLIGNLILGQDARTFPSQDGTRTYASVTGWWKHGKGDDARFQWVDLKMLAPNAEKVAHMLTKGKTIHIIASQVHTETYQPKDQSKPPVTKIIGLLDRFDFVGRKEDAPTYSAPADTKSRQGEPAPRKPAVKSGTAFDDMDDDIPF